jgi:hypothetical protein
VTPVREELVKGCPCSDPTTLIQPDPGRSGYGDQCGNNHCCDDDNYSVQWTVAAGTYHYSPVAGVYCEQSGDACVYASDVCMPGELCVDRKGPYQGHIYVEPCVPAVCCHGESCTHLPKFECEDDGGIWLGDFVPHVIVDCSSDPCSEGACCLPGGGCLPADGTKMPLEQCTSEGGDFAGGAICANSPCSVCDFEDQAHCQLDTGIYIFPSDRQQGTRRADDFRAEGNVINRICFEFGFVTGNPPPECSDDPPVGGFEVRFYEDAFGFPGPELPESVASGGAITVDRAERKGFGLRTWRFSGLVNPPDGIQVTPGECYWIEITGEGAECQTLWVHSRDGNNYGMRDDNDTWGEEDMHDGDVVFCIDTGIVPATEPSVDGGCGAIPVACCFRDDTCRQLSFSQCSAWDGYPIVYGDCNTPDLCPFPKNDLCHIEEDPPNPNRPPTGAFAICEGDPARPELGAWIYWDGLTPETRLGMCEKWNGYPCCLDFGQVCHPQEQDCTDPPNEPWGSNMCHPWGYNPVDPPASVFKPAYECYADVDNRLASTDGPESGWDCFGSGVNSFQADVWYTVTAPCEGFGIATMCEASTEYDSMLGVFGDHTDSPRCPSTGHDNDDLLYCNDDYCTGSATTSGVKWNTFEGATYILRLGGWSYSGDVADAAQGRSQFHIGIFCSSASRR